MIDKVIDAIRRARDYDRLHRDTQRLWDAYEQVQRENLELRKENRVLRRKLKDAEMRLLRRAAADAVLMGGLHFAGASASRRSLKALDVGARRWARACALLKLARIHDGKRITTEGQDEFFTALHLAKKRVEREGMDAMQHRLPLHIQHRRDRQSQAF
jgi:hypothetical protein